MTTPDRHSTTTSARQADVVVVPPVVPPQNLEAEENVLGAMMISAGAIAAIAETNLQPGDFYRSSHGTIYRAALDLHAAGEPVDAITLTDHLHERGELEHVGGKVRLSELSRIVPATANAAHYARIVREQAMLRELIKTGSRIAQLAIDRAADTADIVAAAEQLITDLRQRHDTGRAGGRVTSEAWHEFAGRATDEIPCLVDGLWPESSLGFIAAPPKKGKTWVAIDLAIAVATATPFLGHFKVTRPRPVVLLLLEGHPGGLRARIGCIARGHGADPDHAGDDEHPLPNLRVIYKPRGINIADPGWAREIIAECAAHGAELLVVDVLRAAATFKENSAEDFALLRQNLQPAHDQGLSIGLNHHFVKLSETSKERTAGERMSGSGAMYGAMDVGIFITASDEGARNLRLEFEARDLAVPHHLNVRLDGNGTGPHGGLTYRDTAHFIVAGDDAPGEEDVKAPAWQIRDYIIEHGTVDAKEIVRHFDISRKTLGERERRIAQLGVIIEKQLGYANRYHWPIDHHDYDLEEGRKSGSEAEGSVIPTSDLKPHKQAEIEGVGTGSETGTSDPPQLPRFCRENRGSEEVTPPTGGSTASRLPTPHTQAAAAIADIETYIRTTGWHHTDDQLEHELRELGVTDDQLYTLLDLAADLRRASSATPEKNSNKET